MAQCYHRKIGYLTDKGISFRPVANSKVVSVPCGKCLACRVNHASEWALRALHESQYVKEGCFITLTYNKDNLPSNYSLQKSDVQLFLKRLRRHLEYHKKGSIRAYMAVGEYGSKYGRPHYHLLILGYTPDDLEIFGKSYAGDTIYTSKTLETLWGKGYCPVGTVTSNSAAYVARYSKKLAKDNSGNRPKPFMLASRNILLTNGKKGALGAQWLLDNHKSLRKGYISHPTKPNVRCQIPSYYFDLLEKYYPEEYEELKKYRQDYAESKFHGLIICENKYTHKPSILWDSNAKQSAEALMEFLGLDQDYDYGVSEMLHMANEKIERDCKIQDEHLSKLERKVE